MHTETIQAKKMSLTIEKRMEIINKSEWSEFVHSHPEGNFFQSPEFVKFLTRSDTSSPFVLACYDQDDAIAGILTGMIPKDKNPIKRYFSSRVIIWAGPLARNNNPVIVGLLLDSLVGYFGKAHIYFEFRNHFPMMELEEQFTRLGFKYEPHLNFLLNTENRDVAINRIDPGKRRQIRKSLSRGAAIVHQPSLGQVQEFYGILKKLYASRVRKPLPHWTFFEAFYHSPEAGVFLLIELNGKIIGGIMCPVFKNKVIYEWYIAGEDGLYEGVYPSTLATWAAIEYAAGRGFHHFDFMGAGKPGVPYGVRDFKAKFGGELVSFGRYVRINQPWKYRIAETGLRLLQKLK